MNTPADYTTDLDLDRDHRVILDQPDPLPDWVTTLQMVSAVAAMAVIILGLMGVFGHTVYALLSY